MNAAMAVPGNTAATFLVHFFGSGLADEKYAVERFKAHADGDIRPWPGEAPAKGKDRRAKRVTATLKAVRETGGSVTDVGRVDGRSDLWEITVTPDGTGNVGIVLLPARACGTAGALCTADGRALTTALLVTVPASPQQAGALTAVFADMPADHSGAAGFPRCRSRCSRNSRRVAMSRCPISSVQGRMPCLSAAKTTSSLKHRA